MANCPNCHAPIGCSCNLRTSKDGLKRGCGQCIPHYDYTQDIAHQQVQNMQQAATQMISNINSLIVTRPG